MQHRSSALAGSTGIVLGVHEAEIGEKLPIYPPTPTPILLVETPSRLEQHIGTARRSVIRAWEGAHGRVQGIVSRWIGVEEAVENKIKSIVSPSEPLTPGLLYVGVATLTGSILSRTRALPTRLLLPPSLLFLSTHHFLPLTTQNISAYLTSLEETYVPGVAEKHAIARAHAGMAWDGAKERIGDGRVRFRGAVEGIVGQVQKTTRLKLREGLGWGREGVRVSGRVERAGTGEDGSEGS